MVARAQRRRGPEGFSAVNRQLPWPADVTETQRTAWKREWSAKCADCGGNLYCGSGPKDGWQLEDGRSVCDRCCVLDLQLVAARLTGKVQ